MKKVLIVSIVVFMFVLSNIVVAQQAQRRLHIDAVKSSMSLPGKSTTAYGWHGGAVGSSASPKAKMSRPIASKSFSAVKPLSKGAMPRLTGRTGLSRHTQMPSRAAPASKPNVRGPIQITGQFARSTVSRSTNRARFAQSSRSKSAESSSSSASTAFEGSAGSGAGSVSGAGTGSGTGQPQSTPSNSAPQPAN